MKKNTIKTLISAIIAFLTLTIICSFYYNIPSHSSCLDGVTDYAWECNKNYINATEGLSIGTTNNEGYFNINDYYDGDNIDILIMGSSHMQGMSVSVEDNIAYQLMDKTNMNVYNIGTTGHNFKICVSNLQNALEKYKPKIVVIETNKIVFSNEEINKVLNDEIKELASVENKIISLLQKNPFIRWSYSQIQNFLESSNNEIEKGSENSFSYNESLKIIEYINKITQNYGTEVIILYHPTVSINEDGAMIINRKEEDSKQFKNACDQEGVYFIDMSERYIKEYYENNLVPSGFINTNIASGHINKYGHRFMADEVYKLVMEIE